MSKKMMSKKLLWLPSVLLLALSMLGCGSDMVRVSGTVTFTDGSPVTRGSVLFADGTFSASGDIQPNGSFILTSIRRGDGIRPGEYVVIIERNWDDELDEDGRVIRADPFEVHPRYSSRETSGLMFTVEARKRNVFDIVVERRE